mmetsp:Transcript_11407/g.16634  ORF Transcript_11407/g.16634 Transcript_11407/m.16634 type:complete len:129 (-) Transcript_11407:23-409(-)
MSHSPSQVLSRITTLTSHLLDSLHQNKVPILSSPFAPRNATSDTHVPKRNFSNLSQCRAFTNTLLVLSFVQRLLLSNRTTTNREVYYFFITHFRSQRECDASIVDVANLLSVERIALGLTASPKGELS